MNGGILKIVLVKMKSIAPMKVHLNKRMIIKKTPNKRLASTRSARVRNRKTANKRQINTMSIELVPKMEISIVKFELLVALITPIKPTHNF